MFAGNILDQNTTPSVIGVYQRRVHADFHLMQQGFYYEDLLNGIAIFTYPQQQQGFLGAVGCAKFYNFTPVGGNIDFMVSTKATLITLTKIMSGIAVETDGPFHEVDHNIQFYLHLPSIMNYYMRKLPSYECLPNQNNPVSNMDLHISKHPALLNDTEIKTFLERFCKEVIETWYGTYNDVVNNLKYEETNDLLH